MKGSKVDDIDQKLILELQENSRKSSKELGQLVGLRTAAVRRRITKLISSKKLILTAIPDPASLGFPLHAFLEFRVESSQAGEVAEWLTQFPELHYVSICAGPADIFAWGQFASPEHVAEFLQVDLGVIPGITQVFPTLGLKLVKRTRGQLQDGVFELDVASGKRSSRKLDTIDCSIIVELQRNPRQSNRKIGQLLGLSAETVRRHIDEMVSSGAVDLTAIPIPIEMGQFAHALVRLHVAPRDADEIARRVARYRNVHYVGICFGSNRILAGVLSTSPQSLSEFIRKDLGKIQGIVRVEILLDMENLKRTFGWLELENTGHGQKPRIQLNYRSHQVPVEADTESTS